MAAAQRNMAKKRKVVADGLFYAELNEFLFRTLAEDGYAGVEVRATPLRTEIIIRATRTQNVLGEQGRRIRELTSLIQKRWGFPEGNVELFAERVNNRGLSAVAQAESLRYKLVNGLAVRRACYGVLRYVMESGAMGCEVRVTGKLRQARSKVMKFRDGYMIKSGAAKEYYIDHATRHLLLKQGILGLQIFIMLPHDPTGRNGCAKPFSDQVIIEEPKAESRAPIVPHGELSQSEIAARAAAAAPAPAPAPAAAEAPAAPQAAPVAPVA